MPTLCLLPFGSARKHEQLMNANRSTKNENQVTLRLVRNANWRVVAQLTVTAEQREFVAEPCYYLTLCAYDNI